MGDGNAHWVVCRSSASPAVRCGSGGACRHARETLESRGSASSSTRTSCSPIFFDEKNARHPDHPARRTDRRRRRRAPEPDARAMGPGARRSSTARRATGPTGSSCAPPTRTSACNYRIGVTPEGAGFRIAVDLDKPLPAEAWRARRGSISISCRPPISARPIYLDGAPGLFPRDADGPMAKDGSGDPQPLASGGQSITLSPEDPKTRVTITSDKARRWRSTMRATGRRTAGSSSAR